jgi:hypothetical protein
MPDVPVGPDAGAFQNRPEGRIDALNAVMSSLQLASIRIELFERLVFSRPRIETEYDDTPTTSVRNTLLNELAFQVLAIIWKESEYVSETDLPVGIGKDFPNGRISQLGLARQLASSVFSHDPDLRLLNLGRLNSAIRNIAIAGYIYGLLGRRQLDRTHVEIFGTSLLDELMNAWSIEFQRVASSYALRE